MNLEHLTKKIFSNWSLVKDKKKTLLFLKYQYYLLETKKKKLKLGAIAFEIKEYIFAEITLLETVEIRYIRQDNTETDELKLETRLNALKWKWNFSNIGALIVVILLALNSLYSFLFSWYVQNLPSFAIREERYERLLSFTFESIFISPSFTPIEIKSFNLFLVELLTDYSLKFNIFF